MRSRETIRTQPWFDAARNLADSLCVAAAEPIDRLGWTMFVEQSLAKHCGPSMRLSQRRQCCCCSESSPPSRRALLLARRMVRPIRQIEAGANEIGEGRLDQRIDVKTGDELEALGAAIQPHGRALAGRYDARGAIAERTRDLAAANESKTGFLAAASHDLRQPMHALALFVGSSAPARRSPERRGSWRKVERSVDALADLLDAFSISPGSTWCALSRSRGHLR